MTIVHIHGTTQCTEVHANSIKEALSAYIAHNAWNAQDWEGTTVQYSENDTTILSVIATFRTETCTITHIRDTDNVYYAKWEDR